jgi:GNAT superfamily N-acetyltransferase
VSGQIRVAEPSDVAAMAALAAMRRERYARWQPVLWRPAAGAQDKHRAYLSDLVVRSEVIALVSEHAGQLGGFLIATLVPAPPVYDPGGLTCLIDDFVVVPAANWPAAGAALLRAALANAARRGAVQTVVVTGRRDQPKRQTLRSCGLDVASEWWTTPLPPDPGKDPYRN